jgi:hypothetical protein
MDHVYYSDKTIQDFEKRVVCQNDEKLYKYFTEGDILKFRKYLKPDSYKTIEQAVYVYITDALRDIIISTVSSISDRVKPFGKLIVTGGEAFNMYFDRDNRIVTSDIDTKFTPTFKLDQDYFKTLQVFKLYLWDYLGKISIQLDRKIKGRIDALRLTKVGSFLGISLPSHGPYVTRRYTIIRKTQTKPAVLIDVELFALDLRIRYYSPEFKKVILQNLGGILDMAIMRPYEFGYEVIDRPVQKGRIFVAGKKFLVDDIILMHSLGLRPNKVQKDRKRLYQFATTVLGVKGVTKSTAIFDIYKKIKFNGTPGTPLKLSYPSRSFMNSIIKNINPLRYTHRTTVPFRTKLLKDQVIGSHEPLPDFKPTKSDHYFDVTKGKWVLSTDPYYVRNMYEYRPITGLVPFKPIKVANTLYGWDPVRNKAMPFKLRLKSSLIPFIGLKNTNKVKLHEVRRT